MTDLIPERDLGLVPAAPTDELRAVRGGKSVRVPIGSLPASAAVQEQIDALAAGQAAGQKIYRTWSELSATTGSAGTGAQVIDDTGTHTDPVVGGTVDNAGQYVWSESPAGWRWVRPDALPLKADKSELELLQKGQFDALEMRFRPLDPTTGYGFGVGGANGLFPMAIRLDGTTELAALDTQELNGQGLRALSPWTGYTLAFIGTDGRAAGAIRRDGTWKVAAVEVDQVLLEPMSDWSGYAMAFLGRDGLASAAVKTDGTWRFAAVETETINGVPVGEIVTPAATTLNVPTATQEWWIRPVHTTVYRPYERIVSGAYGEGGEIFACEYVPALQTTARVQVGVTPDVDDHNAPALWIEDGRRAVIAWTNHNADNYLRLRVSSADGDIRSFLDLDEVAIDIGGTSAYAQIFKDRTRSTATEDVLLVLMRRYGDIWGFVRITVDQITGQVSNDPYVPCFKGTEQFYVSGAESHDGEEVIRMAAGFNPGATANTVFYVELDVASGDLSDVDGAVLGNLYSGTGLPLEPSDMTPVLDQTDSDTDRRLFYVRPGPIAPAIAYAEWPLANPGAGEYKVVSFNGTGWDIRSHGATGPAFGYVAAANYIPGVSFPEPCYRDLLYVARRIGGVDTLEEHYTDSEGAQTIRVLKESTEHRITRPLVPMGGAPIVTYAGITDYSAVAFVFEGEIYSVKRAG